MAASLSYSDRPPLQGSRRSFTLPARQLSIHERAGLDRSDANAETFYSHPKTRVIKFKPPEESIKSTSKEKLDFDTDYPVDTVETLPWRARTEICIAAGQMVIEKVQGSGNFIKCQEFLRAIMRNSQCWCVDGESKFVLRAKAFEYYRIELPAQDEADKAKVEELKQLLPKLLRYEMSPCPFVRSFHVDLPDDVLTPRRKGTWTRRDSSLSRLSDVDSPMEKASSNDRESSRRAPPTSYPRNGPVFSSPLSAGRPGSSAGLNGSPWSPLTSGRKMGDRNLDEHHDHDSDDPENTRDDNEQRGRAVAPRQVSAPVPVSVRIASIERSREPPMHRSPPPRTPLKVETKLTKPKAGRPSALENIGHSGTDKVDVSTEDAQMDQEGRGRSALEISNHDSVINGIDNSASAGSEKALIEEQNAARAEESKEFRHERNETSKGESQMIEPPTAMPHDTQTRENVAQEPESPQGQPGQAGHQQERHEATDSTKALISSDDGKEEPTTAPKSHSDDETDSHLPPESIGSTNTIETETPFEMKLDTVADTAAEQTIQVEETVNEIEQVKTEERNDLLVSAENPNLTNTKLPESKLENHLIPNLDDRNPLTAIPDPSSHQAKDIDHGQDEVAQEDSPEDINEDDKYDSISVVSSTDSFHTISSNAPRPEFVDADLDFGETPIASIPDPFLRPSSLHQRGMSEMTVTDSHTNRPSSSGTTTPVGEAIHTGLRQRLRARRSFSPMPPASTIVMNPQNVQHNRNRELARAILQTVLVRPLEMTILVLHVIARVVRGATADELLSGELFRRPDPRRAPDVAVDQVDGIRDMAGDAAGDVNQEDDFGVPLRGRRERNR